MNKFLLVIFSLALISAGTVRADDGKPGNDPRADRVLTLDQFREMCLHPGSDPLAQIAPQHITLQCQDVSRHYVPVAPGDVAMVATRSVGARILSEKGQVAMLVKDEATTEGGKPGECLRYKEVQETINLEKSVSCGEILGIKGDLEDFCSGVTESAKGSSPKLIAVEDTGATIDTCQNIVKTNGKTQ